MSTPVYIARGAAKELSKSRRVENINIVVNKSKTKCSKCNSVTSIDKKICKKKSK